MKIEDLIKTRRSIRKYKDIPVPKKEIMKILEAARWSPSAHNSQPWRFVVIQKKSLIKNLSETLVKSSGSLLAGFNVVLEKTANMIKNVPLVIVVYNSCELSNRMAKFGEPYFSTTKISEIQSVAAAIQNMLLMAHSLSLGSIWLTSPLFCENEINAIINTKGALLAILAFGYFDRCDKKSNRKFLESFVEFH